jgi:hypothetical protein
MPSAPPKVVSAEVVATQPTAGDSPMIARLSTELNRSLPEAAFIVKIELEQLPEPTGDGWALYVGDTRIPKYWEYPGGIYFKVFDPAFLEEHQGEPLRFSHDGVTFVKTGVRLLAAQQAATVRGARAARALPTQADVLKDSSRSRRAGATKARARGARPASKKGGTTRARKTQKPK